MTASGRREKTPVRGANSVFRTGDGKSRRDGDPPMSQWLTRGPLIYRDGFRLFHLVGMSGEPPCIDHGQVPARAAKRLKYTPSTDGDNNVIATR
jgi:hypothetical protein